MLPKRKAFTLVEILIVVILLGILAAIVIPQFGSFTEDANASRLNSDLRLVNSQIELYKSEHGYLPGDDSDGKDGSSFDGEQFVTDLTGITEGIGGKECGPYISEFPVNPYLDDGANEVSVAADKPDDGIGWWFDTENSKFEAIVE